MSRRGGWAAPRLGAAAAAGGGRARSRRTGRRSGRSARFFLGREGRRGRPAPVSCCFCVDVFCTAVFCTAELSALVAHGSSRGHSILPARNITRSTCAALEVVDRSPRHVPPSVIFRSRFSFPATLHYPGSFVQLSSRRRLIEAISLYTTGAPFARAVRLMR